VVNLLQKHVEKGLAVAQLGGYDRAGDCGLRKSPKRAFQAY
jgi:TPR repeat protein